MVSGKASAAFEEEMIVTVAAVEITSRRRRFIKCPHGSGISSYFGQPSFDRLAGWLMNKRYSSRLIINSQVCCHGRSAELDERELRAATRNFNRENSSATRPFLHPFIRFQRETASGVVPSKANPDCLRVGAVAVAEALSVVIVKGKRAGCARMHAQRRRFAHRL